MTLMAGIIPAPSAPAQTDSAFRAEVGTSRDDANVTTLQGRLSGGN